MKNHKIISIIGLIALIAIVSGIFLFTSCKKESKVIKIGAILPLTGPLAVIGEPEREALLLAKKRIDKMLRNSSIKVNIIIEDSKSDPKEAVSIVQKFVNIDNIKYFLVSTSPSILATKPIIKEKKLVMFANTSTPGITDGENIFRISPNSEQEIAEIVAYCRKHNFKKCIFIYPNNEFGQIIYTIFDSLYTGFGRIIFSGEYRIGEKDFKPLIIKLKNLDVDVIIFEGYPADIPTFLKQAREMDIKQEFITSMATTWPACIEALIKMEESPVFIVPTMSIPSNQSGRTKEFVMQYIKRFGRNPNYDALFLYDAAVIMAQVLSKLSANKADEFRKQLYSTRVYSGVSGDITILNNGDCSVQLSPATIKDSIIVEAD